MSIASIAVHMIVHEAISAHTAHKQEETRRQYEAEGIEYLASFFIQNISDENELRWVINAKIVPKIRSMDGKNLVSLINIKHRNEKLRAKGKPIEKEPITSEMIFACHEEYVIMVRNEFLARERAKKEQARAEAYRKAREAYVYENGESDEDIAEKMF